MPPGTKHLFKKRGPGLSWAASGGRGWPFVLLGFFGCHWCLAIVESLKSRGGGIYTSWGFSGFFRLMIDARCQWNLPRLLGMLRGWKLVQKGHDIVSISKTSNQKSTRWKNHYNSTPYVRGWCLRMISWRWIFCGAEVFGVFRAVPEMFDAIGIVPWTWRP